MEKSYTIKASDTGSEMIFVSLGLSIHKETVTNVEAAIGRMFRRERKVCMPSDQFMRMNKSGHKKLFAHLWLLRFIKISSLKMPTAFGMSPAVPPRHK